LAEGPDSPPSAKSEEGSDGSRRGHATTRNRACRPSERS